MNNLEHEIAELEQRLQALDAERATVAQILARLRQDGRNKLKALRDVSPMQP